MAGVFPPSPGTAAGNAGFPRRATRSAVSGIWFFPGFTQPRNSRGPNLLVAVQLAKPASPAQPSKYGTAPPSPQPGRMDLVQRRVLHTCCSFQQLRPHVMDLRAQIHILEGEVSPCNAWRGGQGLCLGRVAPGWSSGSTWASVPLLLALGASVDGAQGFVSFT